MTAVLTQLPTESRNLFYSGQYSQLISDHTNGSTNMTISAEGEVLVRYIFSIPRSETANLGSTVSFISTSYTITAGTLENASASLVRMVFANNSSPSTSSDLLGTPTTAFALTSGDCRAVIPVSSPTIDNQSNSTVLYISTISFMANAAGSVSLILRSIEVLYNYSAIPMTPSFDAITISGLTSANGGISTIGSQGITYSGAISAMGTSGAISLNTRIGIATITGVGSINASSSANVVINNSLVSSSTLGMVVLQATSAVANSIPRVENVAFGSGTITITIRNADILIATGSNTTYVFSFILFT